MRFTAFILSVLIVVLSVLPCSDALAENTSSSSNITHVTQHDDHSHESDFCSPLCTCACCGTVVVTAQKVQASVEAPRILFSENNKTTFALGQQIPNSFNGATWLPPKIRA